MASSSVTMNSNAAAVSFGQLCSPESGGYPGAGAGGYPVTTEHLAAFYGAGAGAGSGGSSGGSAGGGGSSGEPSSPSPYGNNESRHHTAAPETKYEPSHSPTSGIISSDNGLQYANLDGSELKAGAGAGYPGYPGSNHHQAAYQAQAHHLVQQYAHHYGKGFNSTSTFDNHFNSLFSPLTFIRMLQK